MVVLPERERASALLLYLSSFLDSLLFSSSLREVERRSSRALPTRERIIASPYGGRGLQLKLSRVPKGWKASRCWVPANRLAECPTGESRSHPPTQRLGLSCDFICHRGSTRFQSLEQFSTPNATGPRKIYLPATSAAPRTLFLAIRKGKHSFCQELPK